MEQIDKILIADDDEDDFEILQMAIHEISLSIVIKRAENGEILLKILREYIPDIIFLDIRMPCKDGKQCLMEIRSNKKYDLLPVIVYSGIHYDEDVEFCFRNGANLYAFKPSSLSDLKLILEKIFAIDWKKSLYYPPFPHFFIDSRNNGQ